MVREEIVAALKNAIDRGENLQKAMQSIISAGYDPREVQEAARYTNNSILNLLPEQANKNNQENQEIQNQSDQPQETTQETIPETNDSLDGLEVPKPNQINEIKQQISQPNPIADSGYKKLPTTNIPQTIQNNQTSPPKKRHGILITLITIIIILLVILGFFVLFGPTILKAMFGK
jgi:neutral trehalase